MYYGKVRIGCALERGHFPPNHTIKSIVIWENHCCFFDVGRSHARMFKYQKRYSIEAIENNETNSGHKHMPHIYSSRFQIQLFYDESALSRFEVLTKHLYKCNENRPYYATQYQDIFCTLHRRF